MTSEEFNTAVNRDITELIRARLRADRKRILEEQTKLNHPEIDWDNPPVPAAKPDYEELLIQPTEPIVEYTPYRDPYALPTTPPRPRHARTTAFVPALHVPRVWRSLVQAGASGRDVAGAARNVRDSRIKAYRLARREYAAKLAAGLAQPF